jgi:hypothetical protein
MGHHAQYRKRGSTPKAPQLPNNPPAAADWDARRNGSDAQVMRNSAFPAGSNALAVKIQLPTGEWLPANNVTLLSTWTVVVAGLDPGTYNLKVCWTIAGTPNTDTSLYSLTEQIIIPV